MNDEAQIDIPQTEIDNSDAETSEDISSSEPLPTNTIGWTPQRWSPLGYSWSKPFTMVVSASRNSGKSYLVRQLWKQYLHMHFDSVVVFSHSISNGFYQEFLPGKLMFESYSEAVMAKIIQKAQSLTYSRQRWRVLIILDDCLSRKQPFSNALNKVFSMGRHLNISCIFVSQTLKLYLSGLMKENTNLLLVLKQRSRKEREYLIENFLDDIIDDDDLPNKWHNKKHWCIKLLKETCVNYNAMVVELETSSIDYKKIIYKYRA